MDAFELIPANEFCLHHNVEMSFIESLSEAGLVRTTLVRESIYLAVDDLPKLEKFARFYYEMDINVAGIETVSHLLAQIADLHQRLLQLSGKLKQYERASP